MQAADSPDDMETTARTDSVTPDTSVVTDVPKPDTAAMMDTTIVQDTTVVSETTTLDDGVAKDDGTATDDGQSPDEDAAQDDDVATDDGDASDTITDLVDETLHYFPRAYGKNGTGASSEVARAIFSTGDGGYIVAGWTQSFGPAARAAVGPHVWVVKLAWNGDILWQKVYGEANHQEQALAAQPIFDAGGLFTGFYLAGVTRSNADAIGHALVMKVGPDGALVWAKRYSGSSHEEWVRALRTTPDGGCVVAGQSKSYDGVAKKIWVFKLAADGSVDWHKGYGSATAHSQEANDIELANDGSYVITGTTSETGTTDGLLMKVTSSAITWQKRYSGPVTADGQDTPWGVAAVTSTWSEETVHDYVVAGETTSFVAGLSVNDAWVLRIDGSSGAIRWEKRTPWWVYSAWQRPVALADGDVMLVGVTGGSGAMYLRFFALKMAVDDGAVRWGKSYASAAPPGDSFGYAGIPVAADSFAGPGFAFAGSSYNGTIPTGSFWVMRTLADGSLPEGEVCPEGIVADATATAGTTAAQVVNAGLINLTPMTMSVANTGISAANTACDPVEQCIIP